MEQLKSLSLTMKELVTLYLVLGGRVCPDMLVKSHLTAKIEKMLFETLSIEEIENIDVFYRKL